VRLITTETIGFSEAYMDEDWFADDLTAFVSVMMENDKAEVVVGIPIIKPIEMWVKRAYFWLFRNTAEQSLKNVQEHYDIGIIITLRLYSALVP